MPQRKRSHDWRANVHASTTRIVAQGRIETKLGLMLKQRRRVAEAKGRAGLRRPPPLYFLSSYSFPFPPLSLLIPFPFRSFLLLHSPFSPSPSFFF